MKIERIVFKASDPVTGHQLESDINRYYYVDISDMMPNLETQACHF